MLSVSLTPALVFRPICAMRVNGGGDLEPSAITLGMAPTQTNRKRKSRIMPGRKSVLLL